MVRATQALIFVTFEVPGHPQGFVAKPSRRRFNLRDPQTVRAQRYWEYCEKIRIFALQAGLTLPLTATKDNPVFVDTIAYFKGNKHADPENCHKGAVDALFYAGNSASSKGCGDKFTGGSFDAPRYDSENPRLVIRVCDKAAGFPRFLWEHEK